MPRTRSQTETPWLPPTTAGAEGYETSTCKGVVEKSKGVVEKVEGWLKKQRDGWKIAFSTTPLPFPLLEGPPGPKNEGPPDGPPGPSELYRNSLFLNSLHSLSYTRRQHNTLHKGKQGEEKGETTQTHVM